MSEEYREYFKSLADGLDELYEVAKIARRKGLDPSIDPEPQITHDIAERIEKLIGPPGITERMRELQGIDRRGMAFKIAEEIVVGGFGMMETEDAADQAIRTALAIMTEGVTIAPIQGIPDIKVKENIDKSQYLAIYFAGFEGRGQDVITVILIPAFTIIYSIPSYLVYGLDKGKFQNLRKDLPEAKRIAEADFLLKKE